MKKITFNWRKYRTRFIIGLIFITIIVLIHLFKIDSYFTLEQFKLHRANIKLWVDSHYWQSVLVYVFAYIAIVTASIPIAAIMTIVSGFLFGTFIGALYSNIGATIGAICAFLIARYVLGEFIQERYAKQLVRFNADVEKHGAWYLLTIHLVALVPFFIINTLAGLTRISLATFIWTTSIGIFPGSLVYSYAGKQLRVIESTGELFSPQVIFLFGLLITLSLAGLAWKKYRSKKNEKYLENS